MRPTLGGVVILALAALLGAGEPPMTEEDVVRLWVAGRPVAEIVQEVERREPAFDLSPEMLVELRNAGLPETLIAAMTRRSAEVAPARPRDPALAPPAPAPLLRLRLRSRSASVGRRVDPQLAAEWELANAPEDRAFAGIALYVVCVTPDHVPDQWRLASPLGRDFHSMPRHQMLAFAAGSAEEGDADGGRIALDVPEEIEVALETGVAHDLRLGLALSIGGHWRRVTDDLWPGVVVGDANLVLEAAVGGRGPRHLRARFVRDGEDEAADDEVEGDEALESERPAG